MKVWLDILTPKQVLFFQPLINQLERKGVQTLVTTRNYREVNKLSKLKGLKAKVVGKHGGKTRYNKLLSSAMRILKLTKIIEKERIDCTVSYSSVESARVSYGLSIPHYCVSDSPHAEAVSKLTIPLSQCLFTPSIIPLKAWTKYGIEESRIIRYKALDPYVWIKRRPKGNLLNHHVTVRLEEEFASYLLKEEKRSITYEVLKKLIESNIGVKIIVLPRYKEQLKEIRTRFQGKVEVYSDAFDSYVLLASSGVLIGGGGTMTTEAALMGVPSISIYPSAPTYIDEYLIKEGLLIRSFDPDFIIRFVISSITNDEKRRRLREKSRALLDNMEDPVEIIASKILSGSN